MSIYSSISKQLGWSCNHIVTIPDVSLAKSLKHGVEEGNYDCFYHVFEFQRFCSQAAKTNEQREARNIMYEAFKIGCKKYS